jgi:hypothetical protein
MDIKLRNNRFFERGESAVGDWTSSLLRIDNITLSVNLPLAYRYSLCVESWADIDENWKQ